jgi:hypothetical protein
MLGGIGAFGGFFAPDLKNLRRGRVGSTAADCAGA